MKLGKNKLNFFLIVLWMIFIFYMSNQPAEVSNSHSNFVMGLLNYLGINLNSIFGTLTITIIRKGAHITEYLILFMLIYNFLKNFQIKYNMYFLCFSLVVFYASTDEFHQLFIAGRVGRVSDIMIDSIGAIVGLLFIQISKYIKKAYK